MAGDLPRTDAEPPSIDAAGYAIHAGMRTTSSTVTRRARVRFRWSVAGSCIALVLVTSAHGQLPVPTPGATFPRWKLVDQSGTTVSSPELAGKRYLLWFFKANTIGATTLAQEFKKHADEYQKRGVTIFGVSFDKPKDNATLFETEHLPFRLLSDETHELGGALGLTGSRKSFAPRRASFLVNGEGKLERVWLDTSPLTHAAEALADIP